MAGRSGRAPCGIEVDKQIDFHRTLNRQISRPFAFQKTTRKDAEFAKSIIRIGSIANEGTFLTPSGCGIRLVSCCALPDR